MRNSLLRKGQCSVNGPVQSSPAEKGLVLVLGLGLVGRALFVSMSCRQLVCLPLSLVTSHQSPVVNVPSSSSPRPPKKGTHMLVSSLSRPRIDASSPASGSPAGDLMQQQCGNATPDAQHPPQLFACSPGQWGLSPVEPRDTPFHRVLGHPGPAILPTRGPQDASVSVSPLPRTWRE